MISEDGKEQLFNCFALLVIKQLFRDNLCLRFRDQKLEVKTVEPVNVVPRKRRMNGGDIEGPVFKISKRTEQEQPARELPPLVLLPAAPSQSVLHTTLPPIQRNQTASSHLPAPPHIEVAPVQPLPQPKVAYTLLHPTFKTLRSPGPVRSFEYLVLEKESKQAAACISQDANYFLGSSFR